MPEARKPTLVPLPIAALVVVACMPTPPAAPIVREPTPVAASFGRTWDAVIDAFAAANTPIRAIERVSGFIAAERMSMSDTPLAQPHEYADCGKTGSGLFIAPHSAVYNVVVRGDSAQSTVKMTTRWTASTTRLLSSTPVPIECSTKGHYETQFENLVKGRAEAGRSPTAVNSKSP